MVLPSIIDGLVRSISLKKGRHDSEKDEGRAAAKAMSKEAKKRELMSVCSGIVRSQNSENLSSISYKKGQKGINQDTLVVWEEFGYEEDTVFCGIFDGHGPWGHLVSKRVRKSLPTSLLCQWQQTVALTSLSRNFASEMDRNLHWFDTWQRSFLRAYEATDQELQHNSDLDSFWSGTTALTVVKQGNRLAVANVGDSRAVLATTSEDGTLSAIQLTVDFKPNLPHEAERIAGSQGKVFCMEDEPGVYRVWMPHGRSPGLAVSRAFGDYCLKRFGLISVPHVSLMTISDNDHFLIMASDGVWDVISNEEAVEIVYSCEDKEKSARRLVKCAALAWKSKKKGIAMDDISVICLFFHSFQANDTPFLAKYSAKPKEAI